MEFDRVVLQASGREHRFERGPDYNRSTTGKSRIERSLHNRLSHIARRRQRSLSGATPFDQTGRAALKQFRCNSPFDEIASHDKQAQAARMKFGLKGAQSLLARVFAL